MLGIEARDNPIRLVEAISPEERHNAKKELGRSTHAHRAGLMVYLDEIHRIQVRSFSKLERGAKQREKYGLISKTLCRRDKKDRCRSGLTWIISAR
jgi:hypothetical protein